MQLQFELHMWLQGAEKQHGQTVKNTFSYNLVNKYSMHTFIFYLFCTLKSLKVNLTCFEMKSKTEFLNVMGEYKNHSNLIIKCNTVLFCTVWYDLHDIESIVYLESSHVTTLWSLRCGRYIMHSDNKQGEYPCSYNSLTKILTHLIQQ